MATNEINLPPVNDAVSTLDAVYADIFFSKMAEYGYAPPTQEGKLSMLETAAYLDAVDDGEKTASVDPFVDANAKLKYALASENLIHPDHFAAQKTAGIKQAAYALAHEPELYKAVLSYQSALAQAQEQN